MRAYGIAMVLLGSGPLLAACGETAKQRGATGGLGATAGAALGGPAGTIAGAVRPASTPAL